MKKVNIKTIEKPDKISSYFKAQAGVMAVITITGLLYNAMMGVGPILQGKVIDLIINGSSQGTIVKWIFLFILTICVVQFSRYLKRYYVRIFANRTNGSMRMIVYGNIVDSEIEKLKDEKAGDLMTKAISDVGALVEGMRKVTTEIFDTAVLMCAYFVILLYYDVRITLIASAFIPIAMYVAHRMKSIIYRYSKDYRTQLSKVSEETVENVDNTILYRIMGVEDVKIHRYNENLIDLEKKSVKANLLENSMQPIYKTIALIGVVFVVIFGGRMAVRGEMTVGEFSAYLVIFLSFTGKAGKAAKLFNSIEKAKVSWVRIKPFLGYMPKCKPCEKPDNVSTDLVVSNLKTGIVKNASFAVRTGEIVGITGPVASGKSTIGLALQGMGAYDGSIKINNKEISEMSSDEISSYITFMGHESQLLSDTIYNNITLGVKGDIDQVLRHVSFDVDLNSMEEGTNTVVGSDGIRLSGGQQARLALARTLYNRSPIIVLDDPFSAVDINTEKQIMNNLRENYKDCGILLISHRITEFSNVEKVLFVNKGETSFASHDEMIMTNPLYRETYSLQGGVADDQV